MAPQLNLYLSSFSYKQGLPQDRSEHGGGFVFDCRCLPNPGRQTEYAEYSGKDSEVVEYLKRYAEVEQFYQTAKNLIEQAVSNYLEREFSHLMVCFGCTGGRHRSVYMAERVARDFENEAISILLEHRDLNE